VQTGPSAQYSPGGQGFQSNPSRPGSASMDSAFQAIREADLVVPQKKTPMALLIGIAVAAALIIVAVLVLALK
jgi:hypothetical protein